jgi:hypothetical protein
MTDAASATSQAAANCPIGQGHSKAWSDWDATQHKRAFFRGGAGAKYSIKGAECSVAASLDRSALRASVTSDAMRSGEV